MTILALLLAAAQPALPASRAEPRAAISSYVTIDDYPASALRAHQGGTVAFNLEIGPEGRLTDCTVTSSSGSAALDVATCRLLRVRARFVPARDAAGTAVPDSYQGRIVWRVPDPD